MTTPGAGDPGDSLGQEVVALREQVRNLRTMVTDVQEITRLVMTYGPLVDAGDARGTAELWTENGRYEVDGVLDMQGRDQIAEMVQSPTHQGLINGGAGHVLTAPQVTVRDGEAEAFNHAILIRLDGDDYRIARVSANHWSFRNTSEGWKITRRVNRPLDGRAESRKLLARARNAR